LQVSETRLRDHREPDAQPAGVTSASVSAPRVPTSEAHAMSLSLVGAFELRIGGRNLTVPPRAQRLLAFVALHERPLLRPYVAGTLWIDASEERAAGSLRSSLWLLHRLSDRLIVATSTHVGLGSDVDVDIRRAYDFADRVLSDGGADALSLPRDVTLDGELLPDWYDDWLVLERERFRQLRLHALETLAERLIACRRLHEALRAAVAVVRLEPLRESAHRTLISVHLAEGNAGEALRQYRLCCRLLDQQLGLGPSSELEALVRGLTR
jgi:DNA-binding SARP family transcriptional activator